MKQIAYRFFPPRSSDFSILLFHGFVYSSGHQKEANAKDCLLIIDHVTGEITLEKLSSQIMVKKTRSEKPDSKLETPIVLPTQSSRPQTPNNVAKHDSSKSSQNKKVTDHKTGNK